MRNFYMFVCDSCGFSRQNPGVCLYCETPLTIYSKEDKHEYQVDMEEAMRAMSEYKWYV